MRWEALEGAVNLSQVSIQGDAVFLASPRREYPTEPYLGRKLTGLPDELLRTLSASVTIDVIMMRLPSCRASGSDREECEGCEGR